MEKANIKITNITNGDVGVMVDEKVDVKIDNKTYFFTIENFSQEIKVEKNKINIIRPEMEIKLELNKTIESIYKNDAQDLKVNFKLNKITQNNKDLSFNYSVVDNAEVEINNINVEIKF